MGKNTGKKQIYISATLPATNNQAGFEDIGIVFSEIVDAASFSGTEKTSTMATSERLAGGMPVKLKSSAYDYADATFDYVYNTDVAGVVLLLAAQDSINPYSFKVVDDAGDIKYFQGAVTTAGAPSQGASDVAVGSAIASIVYDVVEVAAV